MRQARACRACRERRRRCETQAPGLACKHCVAKRLACTNSEISQGPRDYIDSHSLGNPTAGLLHVPPAQCPLPAKPLAVELSELYFHYVHDQFHTLFHPPSFMQDLKCGKAPPILLYGMMALSARFSTNVAFADVDPRMRGQGYAKECERLLELNNVSITTLRACVLLGAFWITEGNPGSESIYYAVACRIAQLLDIPHRPAESRVEQEVNIRSSFCPHRAIGIATYLTIAWWALCMIDVWSSSGVRLPRLLQPTDTIPLPMEESTFLSTKHEEGFDVAIQPTRKSSLLAEMVRLNCILKQINDLNVRASENELDSSSIIHDVKDLSQQLDTWLGELPNYMRDTRANMIDLAAQGLGRLLVALYLGYYHYGQMLYYRFLHDDSRESNTHTRYYAAKCKQHAGNLCNIVYASDEIPGCDVKYNMVGHVLVIASTIQIHSLLFDANGDNVAQAKTRLEKNFCVLTRLRRLWPTLDFCMDRLMSFHAACKHSADTSFRMDRWMVRFLVEFASPVSDESTRAHAESPWSLSELGISVERS
ncbi:hypothetical protein N7492_006451 [Penicillium capsulatum]|uniref:Zn(2)-C6 fungal-type domain-containing protein n=1 Tax=Penicillium capsulatum TaxID=69766 RepID=A0A9W9LKQ4_9EURO|nr:hypothetical protein N7492_006451 [Penicillium capsulatum]KAJ6116291.1 hypothetical protein N7512_006016 [Penicillium capsulatum]